MSYNSYFVSGDITKLKIDGSDAPPIIPVAWHVPPSGSSAEASWFSPQYSIASMSVSKPGRYPWSSDETAPLDLVDPDVGKIAAMSSAAAAVLGTSGLITPLAQKSKGRVAGKIAGYAAQTAVNKLNAQGMGVCSGENKGSADHQKCRFPSVRFADGGYADDSAIATNIAKMQTEFPRSKVLKIVALDNNPCTDQDCSDGSASLAASQEYNWATLFPGDQGASFLGVNLKNTIFAEPLSSAEISGQRLTSTSKVTISKGTFTTIENEAYGVHQGQTVNMLVVHINANLPTVLIDSGDETTKEFTDLAQSTYEALATDGTFKKFFIDTA